MKNLKLLLTLFLFGKIISASGQNPAPGLAQSKSVFITGVTIHVGNGTVLENGAIGLRNGKFDLVLSGIDLALIKLKQDAYDTVINLNGAHAYPGFIAPNSTLGLNEVDAVRATRDYDETGDLNPHIRSLIAFNTDSKVITTVKTNGVLYAQVTPRGGTISGTSSLVALDAWNWEDAVLIKDEGIHLNFPKSFAREGAWPDPVATTTNSKYEKQINELKTFFENAKAYCKESVNSEKNLRYEAMRGVFDGTKRLYINADYVKDILNALAFVKNQAIPKAAIVGAKDAWKITPEIKSSGIPIILGRVHDLPEREQDDIDITFKLPYLLQKDSILFCLNNAGDMEGMNTRNLPFLAGTARAYGLSNEEAVAALSLNAAKIIGADKLIGSIEPGKLASFFISTGDALDMKSNNVIYAFIDGRRVSLFNSQLFQYEKYRKKYGVQ